MNELPARVESYVMQKFPDLTPSARQQLLRYPYVDREEILMEVLIESKDNLRTLSTLITQRLDTQPRLTADELAAQLAEVLPQSVARFIADHMPIIATNVTRQLLRYTGQDREQVMLDMLQQSKGSLWTLTQLITQKVNPTALKPDQPRKHHSEYGEYEADRLFTPLHIAIQDTFEEAHWDEAYQLVSALNLDERGNRRLIRESQGQMDRLHQQIKRVAVPSAASQQMPSPHMVQRHRDLEQAIMTRFPTQKVAVKRLLARYPDHTDAFNDIVEKSGGHIEMLENLLRIWQDSDDTPADRIKAAETRLEQAIDRFFPQRKTEVMEVLHRYHGKNAAAMRAQLVERSGGQFLDLLDAVDQRLFPEPAPYRRLAPANGPVWLDWVQNGDPRDALMALTPAQAETMKAAYEARVAEGDAAYKAAARAVVPAAILDQVSAQVASPTQQEEILTAFEHYPFGSTAHRARVFGAILQQSQEPQQVLEMVFYQKLGLRTYAE